MKYNTTNQRADYEAPCRPDFAHQYEIVIHGYDGDLVPGQLPDCISDLIYGHADSFQLSNQNTSLTAVHPGGT